MTQQGGVVASRSSFSVTYVGVIDVQIFIITSNKTSHNCLLPSGCEWQESVACYCRIICIPFILTHKKLTNFISHTKILIALPDNHISKTNNRIA